MTVVTSYWLFLESSKYALGKKRSMKSNCINTPLINSGENGFLSDVRMLVWQFGYDESKGEQLSDAMERLEDVARFLKLARIRENNLFQCLSLFHVLVFPKIKISIVGLTSPKPFTDSSQREFIGFWWNIYRGIHFRCIFETARWSLRSQLLRTRGQDLYMYDKTFAHHHHTSQNRVAKVSTRCICHQLPMNELV